MLGYIAVYTLIWVSLVLLIAAAGIHYHWGTISVGQMLSNMVTVEFDGGGGPLVWQGLIGIGVLPVLITAGVGLIHYLRARKRKLHPQSRNASNQQQPWIRRVLAGAVVVSLALGGGSAFASTVAVGEYIRAARSGLDVGQHYVRPKITAENPHNLVVIYLESGEQSFADDELFEMNGYESLDKATPASKGWASIDNLHQYEGGGWTMAGLVATQCGIPLKSSQPVSSNGEREEPSDQVKSYMAGATCWGDVLKEHGYSTEFMGGANTSFAAKDVFLKTHGYDSVKGLAHWREAGERPQDFRSDWGLSDERLMTHAATRIDELHAEYKNTGQPFNLTALTLDTHEPVHVYDTCESAASDKVIASFDCSMQQVAGLVDHMNSQGYLEDTAVVIMGDHNTHISVGDGLQDKLGDYPNRSIYNRIWVPGGTSSETPLRSNIDQLNIYPTVLEAAGFEVEDGQAGLGVSAFRADVPEDSAQALSAEDYRNLLIARSKDFYALIWQGAGQ